MNQASLKASVSISWKPIAEYQSHNNFAVVNYRPIRFYSSGDVNRARQLLPKLQNDYEKNYYAGIICEREGIAIFNRNTHAQFSVLNG
jgi:hypothetical protein